MRAPCVFLFGRGSELTKRIVEAHSLLITAISGSSALPFDKPQSPEQPREA